MIFDYIAISIVTLICLLAFLDLIIFIMKPEMEKEYGDKYVFPFLSVILFVKDFLFADEENKCRKGKRK